VALLGLGDGPVGLLLPFLFFSLSIFCLLFLLSLKPKTGLKNESFKSVILNIESGCLTTLNTIFGTLSFEKNIIGIIHNGSHKP
jgi:hypothetical protein